MRMKTFVSMISLLILMVTGAAGLSAESSANGRTIVVYFSWAENTREYLSGGIDAVSGASTNSRLIAERIHQKVGGDIVGIQTVTPYTSSYSAALDVAAKEQDRQARPSLRTRIANIDQYDVIFLGYPNWWASIPMPIASFLEAYDLSGKTIVPFCSHGGGRLGQSVSAIAKLAPRSTILDALSISYSGGRSLDRDIDRWLKKIGRTGT